MANSAANFDPPPTPGSGFPLPDTLAPLVLSFSPADESVGVALASNIVVTFSEPIARGVGNLLLKTAAGAVVATYEAATSASLSLSGSTLILNPATDLTWATGYVLEFAPGSVTDQAGNAYAGTTSYNFSTVANAGYQTVLGTAGHDRLISTAAAETIDGAAGIDTLVYGGNRAGFTLARTGTGTGTGFSVEGISGSEGTDTLVNVERLEFADKKLALDLDPSGHAGLAVEFIGLLAPGMVNTPSVVGLILGLFDQGQTMHEVCQLALDAGLVNSIAGSASNQALAALVFRNLTGSEADAATIDVLVSYIDGRSASFSQADFMATLAGFGINQEHIGLVGLQQTGIEYI
jgi:hypothetical protein